MNSRRKRKNEVVFVVMFVVAVCFVYSFVYYWNHEHKVYNESPRSKVIHEKKRIKGVRGVVRQELLKSITEAPPQRGAKLDLAKRYKDGLGRKVILNLTSEAKDLGPSDYHAYLAERCKYLNETDAIQDCVCDNEMIRRRRVVDEKCQSDSLRSLMPSEVNSRRLLVMKHRRLVWCPVYKAASTNWMLNIPMLSNYRTNQLSQLREILHQPNEMAKFIAKPLKPEDFRAFMTQEGKVRPVTFMIVRHPFDRLLSAYRDKFEVYNKHFHEAYGRDILGKYRLEYLKLFPKRGLNPKKGGRGR